jgi:hypothetical protein
MGRRLRPSLCVLHMSPSAATSDGPGSPMGKLPLLMFSGAQHVHRRSCPFTCSQIGPQQRSPGTERLTMRFSSCPLSFHGKVPCEATSNNTTVPPIRPTRTSATMGPGRVTPHRKPDKSRIIYIYRQGTFHGEALKGPSFTQTEVNYVSNGFLLDFGYCHRGACAWCRCVSKDGAKLSGTDPHGSESIIGRVPHFTPQRVLPQRVCEE